jgi:hypothetical protein
LFIKNTHSYPTSEAEQNLLYLISSFLVLIFDRSSPDKQSIEKEVYKQAIHVNNYKKSRVHTAMASFVMKSKTFSDVIFVTSSKLRNNSQVLADVSSPNPGLRLHSQVEGVGQR